MTDWREQERTFVVRTQAAREVMASVAIPSKCGSVFLPMRMVERTHARKRERVARPLFPRYVFVSFIEAEKRYGAINRCRGVERILADLDGIPIPVPVGVIDDLRHRERIARAQAGEIRTGWQPGETFKIGVGRYAEFEAVYVGEENGEITVIVRLFGRDFPHQMPFAEVPLCGHRLVDAYV